MRIILSAMFAMIWLSATQAIASEVSFDREPNNPLFRACSVYKIGLPESRKCKSQHVRDIVNSCFNSAKHSMEMSNCLGKGSGICRVVSQHDDTYSINSCAGHSLDVWEKVLENEVAELQKWTLNEDERLSTLGRITGSERSLVQHLEASQSDWLKYRESKCELILRIYFQGSARGAYMYGCKIKATADRAIYLKELRRYL